MDDHRARKRALIEDGSYSIPVLRKKIKSNTVSNKQEYVIEEKEEDSPPQEAIQATLHFMQKYLSKTPDSYFDLLVIESMQETSVSFENIIEACSTEIMNLRPCILIEGETGCGKTTLLRQMATQWASHNVLTNFCAVLLYDVYVEFASKANNIEFQLEEDKKHFHGLSANRSDILILLDVFWIIPDSLIKTCRQYFPNASIVFTAESDLVEKYKSKEIKSITHYYKVLGYESNSIKEALAFSLNSTECMQKFEKWISCNDFADALMNRPLYFDMLIELFKNGALPGYLVNLTQLFKLYVVYLINKNTSGHPIALYSDLKGNDFLLFKSIVELSLSLPKIVDTHNSQMPEAFDLLKKIEFPNHRVLSFVNSSIMAYFMALFCTVTHNIPSNSIVPFDWPVLWVFLGGMNSFKKLEGYSFDFRRSFPRILPYVMFELQSDFSQFESSFLNTMMRDIIGSVGVDPIEPDPVRLYALGWCFAYVPYDDQVFQNIGMCVRFNIPYVTDVSKYVSYFSKGASHSGFDPTIVENPSPIKVDITTMSPGMGNAGKCIDILANSKLSTQLCTLTFSGDFKFESPPKVIKKYLDSLETLDITGTLAPKSNRLLSILPRLKYLKHLALRSGDTTEIDLQCLENLTSVNQVLIIDGFSPDFLNLSDQICSIINVCNCVVSLDLIDNLMEWVMSGDQPRRLGLIGEEMITTEIAFKIATKLNSSTNTPIGTNTKAHSEYTYNFMCRGIVLKDSSMPSAHVFQIAAAVARFEQFELYIPMKYTFDLKNCPGVKFL